MASKHTYLDAAWRRWLKENLERRCDPHELTQILSKNGFSSSAIQQAMSSMLADPAKTVTQSKASMQPRGLDPSWRKWLQENLQRGCDPQQLLNTLLENGFSEESIIQTAAEIAAGVEAAAHSGTMSACDYVAIAAPPLLRKQHVAQLQRIATDALQLYTFDDFLSSEECDSVAAIAARHLRPSTITVEGDDKYYRTSRTCDLSLLNSPVVAALDLKIATTLGIRPEYSEGIQAQRYDVGEQFKKHTDYFEPGTDEYVQFAAERGNRTWTFMVYLNDDMQGGGTRFWEIDRTFQPKKGLAVLWNNLMLDGTPNYGTLHSGEPVLAGHKLIITKWFREKGSGAMFFEA